MVDTKQEPSAEHPVLSGFKIGLSLLTGLFAGFSLVANAPSVEKVFCTVLFTYSIVSIVLCLGWTVPCIIAGSICGLFFGPATWSSLESYMQETMNRMCYGIIAGLLIGLAIEFSYKSVAPESTSDESSKEE